MSDMKVSHELERIADSNARIADALEEMVAIQQLLHGSAVGRRCPRCEGNGFYRCDAGVYGVSLNTCGVCKGLGRTGLSAEARRGLK